MLHKISIGIPTYNDSARVSNVLTSIFLYTPTSYDFKVVVLDDGTPDKEKLNELQAVCDSFCVPLIKNDTNKGIPTSWNNLTKHYDDCDIQVLFNDDICINNSHWLDSIVYFFDNNKDVGSIGWNLMQIDSKTGNPDKQYSAPNLDVPAGRVGSPVGCSFAFLREHWKAIKQPDGSIGFWESLKSFYEETDFGFEEAKRGWLSYHVPYPIMEHWGSQTFANNRELSITRFCDYLSKEEYLHLLKKSSIKLALDYQVHLDTANNGFVYRMDYSRMMFAKKWGCLDYWNIPQCEVHRKVVDIIPKRKIKYLDKDMKEREVET